MEDYCRGNVSDILLLCVCVNGGCVNRRAWWMMERWDRKMMEGMQLQCKGTTGNYEQPNDGVFVLVWSDGCVNGRVWRMKR